MGVGFHVRSFEFPKFPLPFSVSSLLDLTSGTVTWVSATPNNFEAGQFPEPLSIAFIPSTALTGEDSIRLQATPSPRHLCGLSHADHCSGKWEGKMPSRGQNVLDAEMSPSNSTDLSGPVGNHVSWPWVTPKHTNPLSLSHTQTLGHNAMQQEGLEMHTLPNNPSVESVQMVIVRQSRDLRGFRGIWANRCLSATLFPAGTSVKVSFNVSCTSSASIDDFHTLTIHLLSSACSIQGLALGVTVALPHYHEHRAFPLG